MILFLIPHGATLYSTKGRVQGWRYIGLERGSRGKVKTAARALREKGIQKVFCSDLHLESGSLVGRELKVPAVPEKDFRHFNVGRHAGKQRDAVEQVIEALAEKWAENPTIPISGGDSWTSYSKRLTRALDSLRRSKLESVALVLDIRGIQTLCEIIKYQYPEPADCLLEKNSRVHPDHILVVKLPAA